MFAKLLDDQIPFGARILECGCGTGQMSNFLSVANRTVFEGRDMSLHSLSLGQEFKEKNDLRTAHFIQMNLFRPCFKPGHVRSRHLQRSASATSDPFLGLKSIAKLVRPRGYVMIGLYHRYGRSITNIRRRIFRMTGDRFAFLSSLNLRRRETSASKKGAWFMDQYNHPHESTHTIREVVAWLDRAGPEVRQEHPEDERAIVFALSNVSSHPSHRGGRLQQLFTELAMGLTAAVRKGAFSS